MKANKISTEPDNGHVSLELLRQYQADALPPAQQHRVEKHLLDCDLCADILEGMAASPAAQTQRAVLEINTRMAAGQKRRKNIIPFYAGWRNYGVAAAILLLLVSGALVIYYNFANLKQTQDTLAVEEAEATRDTETTLKPNENTPAQTAPATVPKPTASANTPVVAYQNPGVPAVANSKLQVQTDVTDTRPNEAFSETVVMEALSDNSVAASPARVLSEVQVADVPVNQGVIGAGKLVKPDSTALALAPKPIREESFKRENISEEALSGKIAGVQTDKEKVSVRIRGTVSTPMQDNATVLGNTVKGKVTGENGEVLPGVTVALKSMQLGTVTDAQGDYTLVLPKSMDKATLVFSIIGYSTLEKEVKNASPVLALHVKLDADAKALSEVVVVGYGTQDRKTVTGAVVNARPVNGFRAFRKYVQANLKYPEAAKAKGVNGRVVVGFSVNPNGVLSDFKIIKSLSPELDAEALRLVKEGPRWEPTKKDAVAVSEQVRLAIRFKPPR